MKNSGKFLSFVDQVCRMEVAGAGAAPFDSQGGQNYGKFHDFQSACVARGRTPRGLRRVQRSPL